MSVQGIQIDDRGGYLLPSWVIESFRSLEATLVAETKRADESARMVGMAGTACAYCKKSLTIDRYATVAESEAHARQCVKHPLHAALAEVAELKGKLRTAEQDSDNADRARDSAIADRDLACRRWNEEFTVLERELSALKSQPAPVAALSVAGMDAYIATYGGTGPYWDTVMAEIRSNFVALGAREVSK